MPVVSRLMILMSSLEECTLWRKLPGTAGLEIPRLCLNWILVASITPVRSLLMMREPLWVLHILSYNKYIIIILQVLLVTGGYDGSDILDSTEILEDTTWRITAPLSSARRSLIAASIDNKILVFGKNIFIFYDINIIHYYSKYHMPIMSYASLLYFITTIIFVRSYWPMREQYQIILTK